MSVQNNNNFEILYMDINLKKLQFFTSVFVYAKKRNKEIIYST